jgi:hypothetical protein
MGFSLSLLPGALIGRVRCSDSEPSRGNADIPESQDNSAELIPAESRAGGIKRIEATKREAEVWLVSDIAPGG